MNKKKIILFGGTFDPIHMGHTTVAESAAQHLNAERVIFIPAKCSPLKYMLPRASDIDRVKMISLAIEKQKYYEVSDYEISKSSPSYTLDTVRYFNSVFGNEYELYWLVGADSIDDLTYWYGITELIDECNIAMMYRAEYDKPDFSKYENVWGQERVEKLQNNIIPTPLVKVSSTEVRKRIASGLDVAQLLDNTVFKYVLEHGLYGAPEINTDNIP